MYEIRSPFSRNVLGVVPLAAKADIDRAVQEARSTHDSGLWRSASARSRQALLRRFWQLYLDRWNDLNELVTNENGIPIGFSSAVIDRLQKELDPFLSGGNYVGRPEVVAAFVPWNGPQEAALEVLVPALVSGCSVVLVLDPQTGLDGQLLAELLAEAGLWDGVLSVLVVEPELHQYLASHTGIEAFTYYGRDVDAEHMADIGRTLAKRHSVRTRGRPSALILPDANLELAANEVAHQAFASNGVCKTNYTRLFVPRNVHEEFAAAIMESADKLLIGDPSKPTTYIGPAISEEVAADFRAYLMRGVLGGARLLGGDIQSHRNGSTFLKPALLVDVVSDSEAAQIEARGPFAAIMPYNDIGDAIRMSNEPKVQNLSSVWTTDPNLGHAVSQRLSAANVFVHLA